MKDRRKETYEKIAQKLESHVADRTNISVRAKTTGVCVRLSMQRQHKQFTRSETVRRRGSAIQLIEHYTRVRDRFKRLVKHGKSGVSGRPPKIGGGALGVTGVYPNTETGYFNILVQYSNEDGVRKTTELGTLKRTAQETAERIADVLEESTHPDHNRPRHKLVVHLTKAIRKYAEDHGFHLDEVRIPRVWYATLYEKAGAPSDVPHPDDLVNANANVDSE